MIRGMLRLPPALVLAALVAGCGTSSSDTTGATDASTGTTDASAGPSTSNSETMAMTMTTSPDDTSTTTGSPTTTMAPDTSATETVDPATTEPMETSETDPTTTTDPTTGTTETTDATETTTTDAESSSTGEPLDPDCGLGDGPDFMITNQGFADYVIDGANDPSITVVRGCSYTFNLDAAGHPFLIKTVQGSGAGNAYNTGVTNNGEDFGVIEWDVAANAPDDLFYNCQFHAAMAGTIQVIDG
jgi:hypothetical protein